jgi:hypothetical protein
MTVNERYVLQAEKSTLVDALRDSDGEVRRLKNEIANKEREAIPPSIPFETPLPFLSTSAFRNRP